MSKFPVGVIGVGHLGSLHAKMLAGISSVELVGVSDIDFSRTETVAKEVGVKAFESLDELLVHVKAVTIATPTSTHFAIASKVIEKRIHAFIEKPITSSVEEAEGLIRLARKHNVKIQVGHIERFNPALLALEQYELKPMFVESHRLAQFNPRGTDVAVVLDLMIHDIDIILSLVQSPVEKIDANGVAVISDTIDIANARLQFENGCVANVTASRISQKKMRKMRLFQRDAYISLDFSEGLAEIYRLTDGSGKAGSSAMMLGHIDSGKVKKTIVYEQPEMKEVNALKYELELFVGAILHDTKPVVTAEEATLALRIAHDIMEKINRQKLAL
ncbi:MAG: Gfo/Idh/MocA family oxidoreductase [Ignavibacteriae bacterium]|nr:Gfo/Idh/MocA family oxidoreductase [Ignavibacteria bacterium]MBI3365924.1 Gfo/Idh/MocA family oxidoreductase [Ignavibacteriota bacterium]